MKPAWCSNRTLKPTPSASSHKRPHTLPAPAHCTRPALIFTHAIQRLRMKASPRHDTATVLENADVLAKLPVIPNFHRRIGRRTFLRQAVVSLQPKDRAADDYGTNLDLRRIAPFTGHESSTLSPALKQDTRSKRQ